MSVEKTICPKCCKTIYVSDNFCMYCGNKIVMNSLLGPCEYDAELDKTIRKFYPNALSWNISKDIRSYMKHGYRFIVFVWLEGESNARFLRLKCLYSEKKGFYFVNALPEIRIATENTIKNSEEKQGKVWFQDTAHLTNDEFYNLVREIVSYDDVDQIDSWSFFGWNYIDITKNPTIRYQIAKNITNNAASIDKIKTFLGDHYLPTASIVSARLRKILPEICEQIYSEAAGICKGVDGEKKVTDYLKEFNCGDDRILDGIRLRVGDKDFENDVIVINNNGIFTLEIKNYTRGIISVSNDGRVTHNGSVEDDVIMQSERHRNLLIKFLIKHGYESGFANSIVHSIIVISNNTVEVDNRSEYPIIRLSLLSSNIHKNDCQLDNDRVDEICELVKRNAIKNYTHEYHTYKEITPLIGVLKRS